MPRHTPPTRSLRNRPNLDQLKRQAKELLDAFRAGAPEATREVHAHYRDAAPATFALHDAQLVMARAHGFDSWPKLKAFVNGVTVRHLVEAVRTGDLDAVRSMVLDRPELVHLDMAENDEHQALHHAVLRRRPEIVRFLMQHGADARKGIWPHRGATMALTLASERGYDEIVEIITEEEARRSQTSTNTALPALAAQSRDDAAEARRAVATGDAGWLRARHADGLLETDKSLLTHAIATEQPDMLTLLLDLGLDPDEAGRVDGVEEVVPTWGQPLRACAASGKVAMAAILLARGANPNTNVYASSSAMYEAHSKHDQPMIALLEKHGGRLSAVDVAALGLVDHAARLLADEVGRGVSAEPLTQSAEAVQEGHTGPASSLAQDLLWGAIGCPSPEMVALALRATDWPPADPRWHGILENGLYLNPDSDRPRFLEAFRLVLDRSDPDVRSRRNTTLLHEIAASRGGLNAADRAAYTALLLERGASLDIRDNLLQSTPLGWACRWGRVEMVKLLLERGADPIEAGAEAWASPAAWARKKGHTEIEALLDRFRDSGAPHDPRSEPD